MRLQHTKVAAASLSTDDLDRVTAKATIVVEVERLHWRIWNGKAKNAQRSIKLSRHRLMRSAWSRTNVICLPPFGTPIRLSHSLMERPKAT